jgi:MscS family membrane protein
MKAEVSNRPRPVPRIRGGLVCLLAAWALLVAAGAFAQTGTEAGGQEPAAAAAPPEEAPPKVDRSTPRGALLGYLVASREGRFDEAASYLNLAPVPRAEREELGPKRARELKIVLDRTLWVDLDALSAAPEGNTEDGLPPRRDRVGSIRTQSGPVDVLVDRVRRNQEWVWEISSSTVARIPALYEEFGYGPLGEWLPAAFFESHLFDLQVWQWLALLLLVPLAYVLAWAITRALQGALRALARRSATPIDDALVGALAAPVRLLVTVLLIALGALPLGLSLGAQRFFWGMEKALGVVACTWLLLRLVDVLGGVLEERLERQGQQSATSLLPLGRKTLKVVVVALAFLAALDSIGFDVTALIAGLGVGGLAVALAAQKTVENLFGGATIIADRPVRVGDFCRFGDKVGVVEEIGLRSTRVRTLERTLVTVPNAEFSSLQLENFAVRDKILFRPRLGLRYETTPDQMRFVLVEVRRLLYAHPKVDPDPARVRFVGFGAYSLDVDLFAYVRASDFSEYLEVTEDLNLRIMDIVERSGTGFAFPSSTTYLARDDGPDAERTREAESQVQAWRERGELPLPRFTPEQIAELDDVLEYPPPGAAASRRG